MIPRGDEIPEATQLFRPWSEIDGLAIVLTLVAAWMIVIGFGRLIRWLSARLPTRWRFYARLWPPIVRLVVIVAAIAIVVPLVLVPTPEAMFAVAGSSALAIGFAFKDFVSSLIAGVVVLFERPCSVGDWIRVGDVYGQVRAMRLRVIEVVTPEDDCVSIPLSKLWSESIANANSGRPEHLCVADFYVDPDHDPGPVRSALEDVALTSAYRSLDRPLTIVAREERFGTHYRIKAYPFDGADQFLFVTDLTLRGKRALQALGVQAMSGRALLEQALSS